MDIPVPDESSVAYAGHLAQKRQLGASGIQVGPLCLGGVHFGTRTSREDSLAMVDRALGGGIDYLDASNLRDTGPSEEIVGEALERNGRRDQVVLTTQVRAGMAETVVEQCEASLRRLRTDWIDLCLVHNAPVLKQADALLRALGSLVSAGKVRAIGTSRTDYSPLSPWRLLESALVAKGLGIRGLACKQLPYNILDRRIERDLLPQARLNSIAVCAASPLAGGFLSRRYKRGQTPSMDTAYESWARGRQFSREAFDVVDDLAALAGTKDCTAAQLALAWCMHQPGVASTVIAPRTPEQLAELLGAAPVTITRLDRLGIDELVLSGNMLPLFE